MLRSSLMRSLLQCVACKLDTRFVTRFVCLRQFRANGMDARLQNRFLRGREAKCMSYCYICRILLRY